MLLDNAIIDSICKTENFSDCKDYSDLLLSIRQQVINSRWKYLRENDQKFFNTDRNTSLKMYLDFLFPDNDFVYDKTIPKSIQESRFCNNYRRYRPDARSEKLNLIVEFDGIQHYQNLKSVLNDRERDLWTARLGYKTIRIPYWLQLSKVNVKYLFNIDVDDLCELKYGMFDSPDNDYGLSISPASYCLLGIDRFVSQFALLPSVTQSIVMKDMQLVSDANEYDIDVIPKALRQLLA